MASHYILLAFNGQTLVQSVIKLYLCKLLHKLLLMARPIKETPELRGNDAVRFETLISTPKPVSKEEKERARKAYEVMKSISNFQW